jgi:hypothetical protein
MTAFQRQTLVTLSADTNTGKSSLMHILSGENSPDSYDPTRLLMMSRKWDNYTVPGVMNSAVGETLLYNLDEFEHKSDARGSRVESLAEAVRQLTKGTASKVMGTNIPGETRTLNYFLPFMFANIAGATKAQDINRLIQICMRKEPLRGSPSSNILKKFTAKELRRMRYSVNFGAIHHVPKILEHYNRIQTQYSEINSKLNNPVDERLMSSFYSVFSVMEHLGVDWIKFFKEYTDCNSTIIDRGSSTNESDDIMNSILFNPVIKLPGMDKDSRACSLSEIIVSREKRTLLNFSGDGVYFDEDTRLILFNLPTVIERLLPKSIKYSDKLTSLTLRNILERHEKAVSPRDVPSLGIISKAAPVIGAGLKAQNVVVLRVDSWLEEYASNVAEYVSPEEAEVSTTPEEDKIAYEYN